MSFLCKFFQLCQSVLYLTHSGWERLNLLLVGWHLYFKLLKHVAFKKLIPNGRFILHFSHQSFLPQERLFEHCQLSDEFRRLRVEDDFSQSVNVISFILLNCSGIFLSCGYGSVLRYLLFWLLLIDNLALCSVDFKLVFLF